MNIVRVDGPGGFNYGLNGPESDADLSGPGVIKHYVDILNAGGDMWQTFTVPLCPAGTPDVIDVRYGASYSTRNNNNGGVRGLAEILNGAIIPPPNNYTGPNSVARTTTALLPIPTPRDSQFDPWFLSDGTAQLVRGQTYTFRIFISNFLNVDNAFLIIDPARACPTGTLSGPDVSTGVYEYLQARNAMLLTHQPDRHRRLDKINRSRSLQVLNEADEEPLPFDLFVSQNSTNFAASTDRIDREDVFGRWDIWVESYLGGFDDKATHGGLFGVDYKFNERALIGVLAQIDHFGHDFNQSDDIEGTGWMVGPYATVKLGDTLFFDLRGAWGQSSNDVTANDADAGDFDTTRWLVSGAVVGDINIGAWEIRPELQANYLEERSDSFDSNGTSVAAVTAGQGDVRFGPRIAYHFIIDGETMITPYIRADGIYSFVRNDGVDAADDTIAKAMDDGMRARVEAGLDLYTLGGLKFTASGHYDGIGQDDYEIYGGMLRLGVPLN